jgi:hypothetical protein
VFELTDDWNGVWTGKSVQQRLMVGCECLPNAAPGVIYCFSVYCAGREEKPSIAGGVDVRNIDVLKISEKNQEIAKVISQFLDD